ncbi:DUF6364 family protein [Spirochaeta africana]|uniref:Uncharacterized protein n=1 Tax=Spirochaeta africana (strain ATCC 700263 / DSM 8902 / Z-7692) TaxID=889378 RepID=H9UF73_SPIAZ|nr:DUF6364 family protein [Spirochaeta africana]AFG36166.1 hypothetical protein Spiaf_0057 [Spirochaeta africana DSM 8902]
MDTKLTLRLDKEVIDRIKIYASSHNQSVSALTEQLYKMYLIQEDFPVEENLSSSIAKKYKGIIKDSSNMDELKTGYLFEKHVK